MPRVAMWIGSALTCELEPDFRQLLLDELRGREGKGESVV